MKIEIAYSMDHELALIMAGYCPIDCEYAKLFTEKFFNSNYGGGKTYLGMESGSSDMGVRAYKNHFGARRADSRFCFKHGAEANALNTFTIAALSGKLPHPLRDKEFLGAFPHVKAAYTRDVTSMAELIMLTTRPTQLELQDGLTEGETTEADLTEFELQLQDGRTEADMTEADTTETDMTETNLFEQLWTKDNDDVSILLLWNLLMDKGSTKIMSFYAGVALWKRLLFDPPRCLMAAAWEAERAARGAALQGS